MRRMWKVSFVSALVLTMAIGNNDAAYANRVISATDAPRSLVTWRELVKLDLWAPASGTPLCATCDSITFNTDPATNSMYPKVLWWGTCAPSEEAQPLPISLASESNSDANYSGSDDAVTDRFDLCKECEMSGQESCAGHHTLEGDEGCDLYDDCPLEQEVLRMDLSVPEFARLALAKFPRVVQRNPIFGTIEIKRCDGGPPTHVADTSPKPGLLFQPLHTPAHT